MKLKALTLLVLISVLSLSVETVFAEITNPYTVDEKSQVMFGDSTSVSGHNGLENYTHDYVGGYLHITYTYTHSVVTFSSYPPLLYITDVDPRTTAAPVERTTDEVYTLQAGTNATDWYAYDVQFDATGYTVVVKQTGTTQIVNTHTSVTGLTDNDWVALANTYPQAPASDFSMSFTPLHVHTVSSGGGSSGTTSSNPGRARPKEGDRARCVDTVKGWYCPTEQAREQFILETMENVVVLISQEINLLQTSKEI